MTHFRLGPLALSIQWYPVPVGWSAHRWRYAGRASWRHGAAYLGRVKLIW